MDFRETCSLTSWQRTNRSPRAGAFATTSAAASADKHEFIAQFKFNLCFENSSHPGYATKKSFKRCALAPCPFTGETREIVEDFDPGCFVNVHAYPTFAQALERVVALDSDDAAYEVLGRAVVS